MARTLIRIFLDRVDAPGAGPLFLRKRANRWEPVGAAETLRDVERLAQGLRGLGVGPGVRVVLLSETRYEWAVADLAVMGLGGVVVPIYPTLTAPQCAGILANSAATIAIASTEVQVAKLHEAAASLPALRTVVHMDPLESPGPMDRSWETLTAEGETGRAARPTEFREAANRVRPDDLATVIYTSGTTGEPKGAMLTHANIASNVDASLEVVPLSGRDLSLSFLPLCHIFERMAGLYAMMAAGVTIAYAESFQAVPQNLVEVRPTILTAVPRFYEKMHATVLERAQSMHGLRRRLFFWAVEQGRAAARARFARTRPGMALRLRAALADRLVGRKVRAALGGRLRFGISGGAPLAAPVMEFFFAVGIPVLEGYGLTETSPVICLNRPGREKPGSVGPPIPGVEVRIGADGEILTRGPGVMRGYLGNPAATEAALRDGWFHTGDVGHLDPDGSLVITDRLKDLLVTAGGKKVAPQPLEDRLRGGRWIAEAVLLGDRRPYVAALIVPRFAALEAEGRARGWSVGSQAELSERPEVQELIQQEVDRLNADLAPFERVRRFALLPRELTMEAGEITPTLKVRRRVVTERFADRIAELYGTAEGRATA